MEPEVVNKNRNCVFNGAYASRDLYIIMFQDNEREFVVTHNANIKPVSYFTGRETELQELRQRVETGRKSVLVSGMGGIGKTHICRKLFEEYLNKHAEDEKGPFRHLGYIEYNRDMDKSLQNCLKFKQQDTPEQNLEAAWKELEYLAADGKLLLFVDNVNVPLHDDPGLQRLKGIPSAVILTSRQASLSDEFEPYPIGFLDTEQCKEIYEKIRFRGNEKKIKPEEVPDLEYIIENLAGKHTITVELLAHLAWTKMWPMKKLREKLEEKGFCLAFHKNGEIVNIQKSYEMLYDLSELTEAEQNILEAFSVFPYIPLAAETCNKWLLADARVDEDADILMGLYQKGWLQLDIEQESYALHPVFAQFIYEKCKPRMEKHIRLIERCEESIEQPMLSTFECLPFIPFAIKLFEKIDFRQRIVYSEFIEHIALFFERIGEFEKAEDWLRKSFDVCKDILGKYHPITLNTYGNLAFSHENLGDFKRAEKEYKEILRNLEHVPIEEKDYFVIANIYKSLVRLYSRQGEYEKAEKLYEKILDIEENINKNQYDLAAQYYSYANSYSARGKYDRAEKLYEKCLRIRKTLPTISSFAIMASYYELGKIYMMNGKYQDSLNCFNEMNKIIIGEYGTNPLDAYEIMKKIYVEENLKGNFEEWLEERTKE